MTTILIFTIVFGIVAAILDHISGMDKPKPKSWKPKKKNFFIRNGELLDDDYYW